MRLVALAPLLLVPALAACDAAGPMAGAPLGVAFVAGVDHPYFPMTPGVLRVYEGDDEGLARRDEVRVAPGLRVIAGVPCTAAVQDVFLDGELAEQTTEWFAQDVEGSVWKFGEESFEYEDGEPVRTADSWVAGADGAVAWRLLAADPSPGDVLFGYGPEGEDRFEVLSVTGTATVPAGTFQDCLEVAENADDPDDADLIIYAPGVGLVSEQSADGRIDLTAIAPD